MSTSNKNCRVSWVKYAPVHTRYVATYRPAGNRAGAVLSAAGGTAIAQSDDDGTGTVHEVRTLVSGPPTDPERPADFFYQPTGIHVEPGDVIRWVFATPDHNVVSYHPEFGMRRRVPLGVDAFSSPLLGWRPDSIPGDQVEPPSEMGGETDGQGTPEDDENGETEIDGDEGMDDDAGGPVPDTWLHTFETPGVYDIVCSPHEGFGMAMRVVIGDETETDFETEDPSALPAPRAGPVGLARVTLTDPALQPETIAEEGTVEWGDLQAVQPGGTPDSGPQTETPPTEE